MCPVCKQKEQKAVQTAKCGKKMRKGAVTRAMNGIRAEMYQAVQKAKCGKKMRKGAVTRAMNGIRADMYQIGRQFLRSK